MDLTDTPTQAPIASETLVIKPENQKEITRDSGNRNVRFLIPNYIGYFLPSQSNFSFSITMEGRGNPIPSRDAGLHSLFNVVRTYDVTNSHLLEECMQYNTLVAQKFQYTKTTSVDNYRSEFEGVQPNQSIDENLYWKPAVTPYPAGIVSSPDEAKSVQFSGTLKTDFYDNEQFIPCNVFGGLRTELQVEDYRRALEFTTGSMGVGSGNGVCPTDSFLMSAAAQGIVGAEAGFDQFTIGTACAGFIADSVYEAKAGATVVAFIDSGTVTGAGGLAQPSLYSLFGGNSLPVAGTVLDIVAPAGGTNAQITVTAGTITLSGLRIGNVNDEYFVDLGASDFATQLQSATSPKAADITYFGDGSVKKPFNILNQLATTDIGYTTTQCFPNCIMPFSIGDRLFVTDLNQTTANKRQLGIITRIEALANTATLLRGARIHFVPDRPVVTGLVNGALVSALGGGTAANSNLLASHNYGYTHGLAGYAFYVEESDRANGYTPAHMGRTVAPTAATINTAATTKVGFTIRDLQYNVKRVDLDPAVVSADLAAANSSSGYRLDLATTQTRLVNLQAIQGPTSQLISIPNITKALAILSVPLNQNNQLTISASSLRGISDNMTNYQYDIGVDGLQPQRKVDVQKANLNNPLIQTQHINELIKAVEGFDMELSSLNNILMNFAVGRQFSRNDMFYNLMEAGDLTLRSDYDTSQTVPKLVVHFIHHIRQILVTNQGIQIAN
mgnify:CR=1 FL=1